MFKNKYYIGIPILLMAASALFITQGTKHSKNLHSYNLPLISMISHFELYDQAGQKFGWQQLQGHVWIANFIFTRCQGSCPILTKSFVYVQQQLKKYKDIKFVSITMDPKFDRPDVLKEFGKQYKADFSKWTFLTGDQEKIIKLAKSAFKIPAGKNPEMHSTRMVLIDQQGNIRGYYEGLEKESLNTLIKHVKILVSDISLS